MRKRMYKAKKHWVIASAAALTVLGTSTAVAAEESQAAKANEPAEVAVEQAALPADTSSQGQESEQAPNDTHQNEKTVQETEPVSPGVYSQVSSKAVTSSESTSDTALDSENYQSTEVESELQSNQEQALSAVRSAPIPDSNTALHRASVAATVARTSNTAQPQAPTETTSVSVSGRTMTIRYNKTKAADESVNFAVWSDERDQDDLVWYRADAQGAAYIDLTKHKSYGTYHIHTYSNIKGRDIGRDGRTADVSPSKVTTKIEETSKGNYTVTIGNVSSDITAIRVPVWSQKNDQDDIIWYQATQKDPTTYTVSFRTADHHNDLGHYNIHVYGQSAITGSLVGLSATSGVDYKVTAEAPKAEARHNIKASLGSAGIELGISSNTLTDLGSVRYAVWSEQGGQDDLKWYSADRDGKVTAPYSNHSGYGTYNIHTYALQNGQMVGLNAQTITIAQPSANAKANKVNDTSYAIQITNLPQYITAVKVPVWTNKNDQDDLIWYDAAKNADGSYTATVQLKNHNYETGSYTAHIYGVSALADSSMTGLGSTTFNVDKTIVPTNADLAVKNHDEAGGTLQVVLNDTATSKQASKLAVAVWSQDNQANLHWYEAGVANGSATVYVDEKLHGYIKGNYTVHAYVTYRDGSQSGHDLGKYSLQKEQSVGYFVDVSSHNGDISVADYQSLKNQGITGVVVKLTEGTSYINPYAARQIANARAAGMKISVYHFARYTNADEARAEAAYFVNVAKSYGLSSNTVMVNDMESSEMLNNINANTAAWTAAMQGMGYNNLVYYTMASWLDTRGGSLNTSQLGMQNMWIAHYVNGYTYLPQNTAQEYSLYSDAAAWQYTSVSRKLAGNLDENIDYIRRFS
ncbi:GBS Bsp-like repeat-containing protein [Streptococcus dentasini]